MSALVDIESALAKCGQGQFEKLVGAFLHARGVRGLSLLGSVVGKEKTRAGVPDAFGVDGTSFTFVACTTETGAKNVENKLLADVVECVNTAKTGVPVEAIDVAYLAFNSVLSTDAQTRVVAAAETHGLRVTLLSVSELALDLSHHYPWLAKEFFGIEVDTNQILSVDAFVNAYDKGLLATPLETRFLFRETELTEAVDRVGRGDLVIKGAPGAGKTRFALELVRHMEAAGWQARCVLSSEQPVIQDIARHFSDPGRYVVLLDDANRVTGLEPVVGAILERVGEERIRFIFTVRSYAHREVLTALTALRHAPEELELGPFSQEQVQTFLDRAFGIRNGDFQRQIWRLSQGNARLATMAAKLALETQDFAAITNLTRLYDAYYRTPIERADAKGDMLIPVLALLGVLKTLRADATETIAQLEQTFGWNQGSVWKATLELHRLECVELHRHRVARVSDQILAGYAFFLVFVDRHSLSLRTLVDLWGDTRLRKLRDAIFSIENTMDSERIRAGLVDEVHALLHAAEGPRLLKLLHVFWYFEPDFALTSAARAIDAMPASTSELAFEEKAHFGENDVLALLACLAHDDTRQAPALHLALQFLTKQPDHGGRVLSLLTDMHGFGIHQHSDHSGFKTQRVVTLALDAASRAHVAARQLLLRYAKTMLRTEFEGSFSEGRQITISRIRLTSDAANAAFRDTLWESLLACADYADQAESLRDLLWDYAEQIRGDADMRPVVAADLSYVARLFEAIASSDRPEAGALAAALNRRFLSFDLEDFAELAARFESDANHLLRRVATDWDRVGEDYEAEEKERRQRVVDAYAAEDAAKVVRLFTAAAKISRQGNDELFTAWRFLLDHWAEHDPAKLLAVSGAGLPTPMALTFPLYAWVGALLRGCGREQAQAAIAAVPEAVRDAWRRALLTSLPASEITKADVEEYLTLMAQPEAVAPWIRDLQQFVHASPRFLPRLIDVLLGRDDGGAAIASVLRLLGAEQHNIVRDQLGNDPELLSRAYLKAATQAPVQLRFDHNAALFGLLLDLRPGFLSEYFRARIGEGGWIFKSAENHRDYRRLWQRPDWSARFQELLEALTQSGVRIHDDYLAAWLPARPENGQLPAEVMAHLQAVVEQHAEHVGFMRIVFSGVSGYSETQRLELWRIFLTKNQTMEAFNALPILPSHFHAHGSLVPVLQGHVRFLERLAELMTSPELMGHRMRLLERMRDQQQRVEAEVESDFIDLD
jgi:hypothetical protein